MLQFSKRYLDEADMGYGTPLEIYREPTLSKLRSHHWDSNCLAVGKEKEREDLQIIIS